MKLLIPISAALLLCMPGLAQHSIVIEDVAHVSSYRDATIVLTNTDGITLHYVLAPLTEFRVELPDTLIWESPEMIAPIVLTVVYTSTGGIRIIIQVPCSRYATIEGCVKALAKAVDEMEKHFPRDPIASKEDTTIVIPGIGKK